MPFHQWSSLTAPVLALDFSHKATAALLFSPKEPQPSFWRLILPKQTAHMETDYWRGVCTSVAGIAPKVILTAPGTESTSALPDAVLARFADAPEGIPVSSLFICFQSAEGKNLLSTGNMPSFCAVIAGFLGMRTLQKRQMNEGVLLAAVEEGMLYAALVYQMRIFGMLALPLAACSQAELIKHLDSFRLGWLPTEVVEALGGRIGLCAALPAAAEGYKPMFITGADATRLGSLGRVMPVYGDTLTLGCWGLLAQYAVFLES